ncbi:hypothetical protein [Caenimonas sedimenti]|nr:hypothetical protein [Caenimonas sedimenti]
MHATDGGRPFTDEANWAVEIKYDGYRTMAGIVKGEVELRTKNGVTCSHWWPEIVGALQKVPGGPHVVDGEAAVLVDGQSDFNKTHRRAARRGYAPGDDLVVFCAFDILIHKGRDVMGLPYTKRKELLSKLLVDVPGVLVVTYLPANVQHFATLVEGFKLEGFVAKKLNSLYLPGIKSRDWLKIKRKGWNEGRNWKS